MNRKIIVPAFLLILSMVILIQPASVSAKPTSVTFQTSQFVIVDVTFTNLGGSTLVQYHYSSTTTGIFAGTCSWLGTGTVIPEKSIKDTGYFTIATSVGSITLKTVWNAVWDGATWVQTKGSWTIVTGTGVYAAVSGSGTFERNLITGNIFEGVIR
jgi:hypothetical protein